MANWDINKLKEILCPLGFVCKSFIWQGNLEHFFEIANTPMGEYFMLYKEGNQKITVYPYYDIMLNVRECGINEIDFDLVQDAQNYITTYKEYMETQRRKSLEQDFSND